jgi:hypothetical protein
MNAPRISGGRAPRPLRPRARWLALPFALAVLTLASGASAVGRYTDARGDSGTAPDLTGVTVASDPNGQILFTIQLADLPSPAPVGTLLFLDTDQNGATGSQPTGGADYVFAVDEEDNMYWFDRWSGAEWVDTPYSTVRVNTTRNSVLISVNRSELGNTSGFNFWVRTVRWDNDDRDSAPEDGLFNYSLRADGPDIRGVRVATTPAAGPTAGRPFVVTARGLELPPAGSAPLLMPRPETTRCAATLAGKRLAGRGAGGCTLAIPRTARGKQLAVVLTVTYQGATKSFRFAYRVR